MTQTESNEGIPLPALAIVGMACRLPGADNLDEYWRLLIEGRSALGELPVSRFDKELSFDPRKGVRAKSYSCKGGVLSERPYDLSRSGIPEELARGADRVHIDVCEVAIEACRHARLDPFNLPRSTVGVYIGHNSGTKREGEIVFTTLIEQTAQYLRETPAFRELAQDKLEQIIADLIGEVRSRYACQDSSGGPELAAHMAAALIAQTLRLDGPFCAVDAACASSMQALAMGARSLALGEIEMAIVGGASHCRPDGLVLFSQAQSLSADESRPFDAEADGLISAEGYVILLVKTLKRAIDDGDDIHAIIRGIGVSSDGRGKSLWAPRQEGQIKAVTRAYGPAVDMSRVRFVEAHATSTAVGDATEMGALSTAMRERLPKGEKIPIGSAKANVGHTLETAGMAGMVKTILALRHGVIPPQINVRKLSTEVDWENSPFFVPTRPTPWHRPTDGHPRRAAVNAFGIGGLNVHVVLDEFDPEHARRIVEQEASAPAAPRAMEPIAIVGMGAVLPGARTIDQVWDLLSSSRDPKSEAPRQRWDAAIYVDRQSRRTWRSVSSLGGFIRDFEFDWKRHKVPPKQVANADPLQFLLLDAVDQALSNAGYDRKAFDRERTGVVVGTIFGGDFSNQLQIGLRLPTFERELGRVLERHGLGDGDVREITKEYGDILLRHMPSLGDETGSFTSSTLASRITKTFDLMGGAAAIDSGAASSMMALSAAVNMLRVGSHDMVVCAAGQRRLGITLFEALSLDGSLASEPPRGPFDEATDGYVPGEGVGVVLLKRLSDAVRDGDNVKAIIRGVGVSRADSLDAAVRRGVERALNAAGVSPKDITCLESGSPGLREVDRQEILGVAAAYGGQPREAPLVVGSLAARIGFISGGSGMASLIKAALELDHREVAPNTALGRPAEFVRSASDIVRLEPASAPLPVAHPDGRLFAGVNSFGKANLACHVILERATPVALPDEKRRPTSAVAPATPTIVAEWRTWRWSAETRERLIQLADAARGRAAETFAEARPTAFGRGHQHRLAIVARGADELAGGLKAFVEFGGRDDAAPRLRDMGVIYGQPLKRPLKTAFLFAGQGSQYGGMFKSLVDESPAALAELDQIEAELARLGQPSFREIAWDDHAQLGKDVWRTQLAVLVADMLAHRALSVLGVRAHRMAGHSYGEFAALVAAGAWSFATAAEATRERCRAIEDCDCAGGLLSIGGSREEVERLIAETGSRAFISHFNAPDQTVVGGVAAELDRLIEPLRQRKLAATRLNVPRPFHTPLMSGAQEAFRQGLAAAILSPPSVPFLSGVTCRYVAEPEEIRDNLVEQLTRPVLFAPLVERLIGEGVDLFIEIGPRQVLARLAARIAGARDVSIVATDHARRPGLGQLLCVQAAHDVLRRDEHEVTVAPSLSARSRDLKGASEPIASKAPSISAAPASDGNGRAAARLAPTPAPRERSPAEGVGGASAWLVTNDGRAPALANGRRFRAEIRAELRRQVDRVAANGTDENWLSEAIARKTELIDSKTLDGLRGLAEGAQVNLEALVAYHLRRSKENEADAATSLDAPSRTTREPELDVRLYDELAAKSFGRHEMRFFAAEAAARRAGAWTGAALIVGDGEMARALATSLRAKGIAVELLPLDAGEADLLSRFEACWARGAVTHLFLVEPFDARAGDLPPLERVLRLHQLCQAWYARLLADSRVDQASLVACVRMGGDFGFASSGVHAGHGALTGLVKGLDVELSSHGKSPFRARAIDFDDATTDAAAAALAIEEFESNSRDVEVAYRGGRRYVPRPVEVPQYEAATPSPPPRGAWVVTGGARGITARVAAAIAARHAIHLHLLGTSPRPAVDAADHDLDGAARLRLRARIMREAAAAKRSPIEAWRRFERDLEIDSNLRKLERLGVAFTYHTCDVTDRQRLAEVLAEIRGQGQPIRGVLHGAGYESAARFEAKRLDRVRTTLAVKAYGALALAELLNDDPLDYFIGFSSISARCGGLGQSDYCMANEMLSKLVGQLGARRPTCRAAAIHWHAWDDVGMAVRDESKQALVDFGLSFMPAAEGVALAMAELERGMPRREVLVTDAAYLKWYYPDLDSFSPRATRTPAAPPAAPPRGGLSESELPLVDRVVSRDGRRSLVIELTLDPKRDPFLAQHVLDGRPRLPAVIGMGAMAQAAALLATGESVVGIRDFRVAQGLKFFDERPRVARVFATRVGERVECRLTCDMLNRAGRLVEKDRAHMSATIVLGAELDDRHAPPPPTPAAHWINVQYPPELRIQHGPVFRALRDMGFSQGVAQARFETAPLAELGGERRGDAWLLPAIALDAAFFACGIVLWTENPYLVAIPSGVESLEIFPAGRSTTATRGIMTIHSRETADGVTFDFVCHDEAGRALAKVNGYACSRIQR